MKKFNDSSGVSNCLNFNKYLDNHKHLSFMDDDCKCNCNCCQKNQIKTEYRPPTPYYDKQMYTSRYKMDYNAPTLMNKPKTCYDEGKLTKINNFNECHCEKCHKQTDLETKSIATICKTYNADQKLNKNQYNKSNQSLINCSTEHKRPELKSSISKNIDVKKDIYFKTAKLAKSFNSDVEKKLHAKTNEKINKTAQKNNYKELKDNFADLGTKKINKNDRTKIDSKRLRARTSDHIKDKNCFKSSSSLFSINSCDSLVNYQDCSSDDLGNRYRIAELNGLDSKFKEKYKYQPRLSRKNSLNQRKSLNGFEYDRDEFVEEKPVSRLLINNDNFEKSNVYSKAFFVENLKCSSDSREYGKKSKKKNVCPHINLVCEKCVKKFNEKNYKFYKFDLIDGKKRFKI